MPKKKTQKKEENKLDLQKFMKNSDSYKSLIYGIVTVVVLFIVIALGVRTLSQNQAEIDNEAAVSDLSDEFLTNEYVVNEGETLWSIAEKSYNNGYAWEEIAKANNLKEPYALTEGQKLRIPRVSVTNTQSNVQPTATVVPSETPMPTATVVPTSTIKPTATIVPTNTPSPTKSPETVTNGEQNIAKITSTTYVIVEGDNLWTIAERAYGDGFKWVEIAKVNKLQNPDLIYPDDKVTLPR